MADVDLEAGMALRELAASLMRERDELRERLRAVEAERDALLVVAETGSASNLENLQLHEDLARLRAIEAELAPLVTRMAKGRAKYPTGCTLLSLLDEAGEVAHATNKGEAVERVRDELLDVAAVAMRLYLGEVDTAHDVIARTQDALRAALAARSETKERA